MTRSLQILHVVRNRKSKILRLIHQDKMECGIKELLKFIRIYLFLDPKYLKIQ